MALVSPYIYVAVHTSQLLQAYKAYKLGGKVSELLYSPALYGIDLSAQNMPKPRARSSPMLAVVGNTLWLFGGTVEVNTYLRYKLSVEASVDLHCLIVHVWC